MRGAFRVGALAAASGALSCGPSEAPSAADTAAYLGLADGAARIYALASGATEVHSVTRSAVPPTADGDTEGLMFDVTARQNGFVVDERTLTLELSRDGVRIVRFFDCIARCGQPSTPIPLFAIPLETGAQESATVDVALTASGDDDRTSRETHAFVVGDTSDVDVPAGAFEAFTVSWTRTDDAGAKTALLRIAPGTGIVAWDAFDGASLRLR